MEHIVKIQSVGDITHNVKRFRTEKPDNYTFTPGQATEVSINSEKWKDEKRPFSFTSLGQDPFLEFTIKIYPDHDGVTEQMAKLKPGDELIIRDTWGAIEYKGPGYIIAGGAGITPYLAILRDLKMDGQDIKSTLFFSNKTDKDIILKDELDAMLGDRVTYVITDQEDTNHVNSYIDKDFLLDHVEDFDAQFYVCGPPEMTEQIGKTLRELGASTQAVQLDDQ
ncbi:FAD-binding oxidoreductase [Gramella sp. GC03-9]|uniref:FAD-binding oxidoreductase n=1 Tax=Christiangramia oceanisediminis TaxID=2920386 RepID=A0A9X2KW17_9FLAO|nr:FAD-binding oxidoreductase [Gramella oceanisediminis]MCP9199003.1 FAD-binding oxidoreductase [Gramella oceanisediminis]